MRLLQSLHEVAEYGSLYQSRVHSDTLPPRSAWLHFPSPFGDSEPTSFVDVEEQYPGK